MLLAVTHAKLTSTFRTGDFINIMSILITLIGFIVTYKCLKKEYNLAIIKEKNLYATNEMKETLDFSFLLLNYYMKAIVKAMEYQNNKNPKNEREFKDLAKNLVI